MRFWTIAGVDVRLLVNAVKVPKHLNSGSRSQTHVCLFAALLGLLESTAALTAAPRDAAVAASVNDPWERENRRNYAIEGTLDRHVIGPAARFYHKVTPGLIGVGIQNVSSTYRSRL